MAVPSRSSPPGSLVQPPPLRPGDRVRLVAASSALRDSARLESGVQVLRDWGLTVEPRVEEIVSRRWGYLAGRDEDRLLDLTDAVMDSGLGPQPALAACVRGGWGSARLLEHGPTLPEGWLLGFSDVTSLLWARVARGQGGGVHGPLLTTLAEEPDWSRERLRALLFGEPVEDLQGDCWCSGMAEGPLLVANLTVATHLIGTPHLPDLRGAILILEDVGEAPYRIDRMLTHWRLSGVLQQLAGLGFGSFEGCDDIEEPSAPDPLRVPLESVLRERTADLGIPVVSALPVGHRTGNAALCLGAMARLDGDRGRLSVDPPPAARRAAPAQGR